MKNPWAGGAQYGGRSAHLEHSLAGGGQEMSQGEGEEYPAMNTDVAPGLQELLNVVLSSVSETAGSLSGQGAASFPSSHTVKTFP